VAYGDEAIRALVNHAVTTGAGLPAGNGSNGHVLQVNVGSSLYKVGELAPRFSLSDLRGRLLNSEDFLGEDTLLLFWNSGCSYCQAMTEEIRSWEDNPPKRAPRLVILASGREADIRTRTRDLRSLILLDTEFDVGPMFGSNSTPSAVLIDGEGKIASSLLIGERKVLALAGVRKVELPIASFG
jgi:hypothetical protein